MARSDRPARAPRTPLVLVALALALAVVIAVIARSSRAPRGPASSEVVAVAASASASAPASAAASSDGAPLLAASAPSEVASATAPATMTASSAAAAPVRGVPIDVPIEARAALRAVLPRLRACYEQARRAYPTAGGRATMKLAIGSDGRVTRAEVAGATPPSLAACMQKVGATMQLAPGDAPRSVSIPLALDSR